MKCRGFFIIYTLLYLIGGSVFITFVHYHNWEKSIYDLSFGYGSLLHNIINNHKYVGEFNSECRILFSAHRLPSIPYLIIAIKEVFQTEKIIYITVIKNVIFAIFWFTILYKGVWKRNIKASYKILFILLISLFPQIIVHGLQVDLEEAYVIPLLANYFLLVTDKEKFTTSKKILFTILPTLLFLSRNIFLYICPVLLVVLLIFDFKKVRMVVVSSLLLVFTAYGIALFNEANAHRFTLKYSWEWMNIYKGNNEKTLTLYPKYSLDILDYEKAYTLPDSVKDEWSFNDFFKDKTLDYIKHNLGEIPRLIAVKFFTVWLDIRPNGYFRGINPYDNYFKLVGILFMFIFRVIQWSCIFLSLKSIFSSKKNYLFSISIKFLLIITIYYLPYTIAYGFERHITPMIIPCILYLIIYLENK